MSILLSGGYSHLQGVARILTFLPGMKTSEGQSFKVGEFEKFRHSSWPLIEQGHLLPTGK